MLSKYPLIEVNLITFSHCYTKTINHKQIGPRLIVDLIENRFFAAKFLFEVTKKKLNTKRTNRFETPQQDCLICTTFSEQNE